MSYLLCGSYFNCDPAEDSDVCFVERSMSKTSKVAWSVNDER